MVEAVGTVCKIWSLGTGVRRSRDCALVAKMICGDQWPIGKCVVGLLAISKELVDFLGLSRTLSLYVFFSRVSGGERMTAVEIGREGIGSFDERTAR